MAKQGERLTKRLAGATVASALAVVIAGVGGVAAIVNGGEETLRNQVVELNDVRAALTEGAEAPAEDAAPGDVGSSFEGRAATLEAADQALASAQDALRGAAESRSGAAAGAVALVALVAIAAIALIALYLYRAVARPFARLEGFAEAVAAGDLDAPLAYERSNPFGKFTWAFDHLRGELARARADEERAREAHKTALASLSHDLRTPLASLRAYAEALEMGLVVSDAERAEYERAIMRKCDEASSLVEDLLQHALSDMDRISVQCAPVRATPVIRRCAADASGLVRVACKRLDDAVVNADEARLAQIVDNLVGNAIKYASGSPVEIEAVVEGGAYAIKVRDFGPGMPPEDVPFATERFFRGSNVSGQPGSGLGLFISAYLAERMGGRLRVENAHPGLQATVELPLADDMPEESAR